MNAILIDPFEKTVTTVDAGDGKLADIYRLTGCDLVTTVQLDNVGTTLWLDDEGMFRHEQAFFKLGQYPTPLAGKSLILGTDDEGNCTEPLLSAEFIDGFVRWVDHDEVRRDHAGGAMDTVVYEADENMQPSAEVSRCRLDLGIDAAARDAEHQGA